MRMATYTILGLEPGGYHTLAREDHSLVRKDHNLVRRDHSLAREDYSPRRP